MTKIKHCPECPVRDSPSFELESDEDYAAALEHYLEEHPRSERLKDVVEGHFVNVACSDCDRPFWGPAKVSGGEIVTEAYCVDCEQKNYVRALVVQTVSAREFVEREGEPLEDPLEEVGSNVR